MEIKKFAKERFRTGYDVIRSVYYGAKQSKLRKQYEEENRVCHNDKVPVDAKLAKLFVEPSTKRINIVMKSFSKERLQEKEIAEMITLATVFSHDKKYSLRIISRNNLPNPKVYQDFVKEHNLKTPESISFYTDSVNRVSAPVFRLETTKGDRFFTENELAKLKELIKNEK